jgi:AmmeMemoRadiSam system protein B
MALPTVDAFETPLGPVAVDADARAVVAGLPAVVVDDEPHASEHAIETQLPFLIRTLGWAVSVSLLPSGTRHQRRSPPCCPSSTRLARSSSSPPTSAIT